MFLTNLESGQYIVSSIAIVVMKLLKPITSSCISVHKFVIILCIVDHNTLHFW